MKLSSLFSANLRYKTFVIALCLGASLLASPQLSSAARADDFSTVTAGDALYGQLKQVQNASWTPGNGAARIPNTMTRYEMALEAARAYLALSARHKADANWQALPPSSLRALREMMTALRPELQRLDVDVNQALALCETLLNGKTGVVKPDVARPGVVLNSSKNTPDTSVARANSTASGDGENSILENSAFNAGREVRLTSGEMTMKLSQRLRISAAQSSLERTVSDPFSYSGMANTSSENALSATTETSATLEVTDWLRLRAGVEERSATPDAWRVSSLMNTNRAPSLIGGAQSQAIGGGLDIEVRPGLRLSGNVARVAARDFGASENVSGTRFGGGVDLSAWQNRLALSVNLSRLVPEDSARLASSSAALNVAVGGDRLKLKLLYKQLFGEAANTPNNRVFAGVINNNF